MCFRVGRPSQIRPQKALVPDKRKQLPRPDRCSMVFGCLPKANKVILWYNKCGLLAFWCFSICAKEQGVIPTFDSGFVANVINQKVFLSISQAPTRRWSFWQMRCLLLCHELLGRKRVSQPDANFRTELCSLLECSARSGSAPLQRQ